MKSYTITVKEIHDSYVEVEANSAEEAIQKVRDGEGTEVDCEYNSTMQSDTWNVHENEPEPKQ